MIQRPEPRIILASASAARRALLANAGLSFVTEVAAVDEAAVRQAARQEGSSADDAALLLAELKGRRIAQRHPDALVIAADQILVCGETWFEKPADMTLARAQLLALRGRTHVLVTAVLCLRGGTQVWQHVARPALTMREFSEGFLEEYLEAEKERILGSVGAYRLEGLGVHLFARVEGEYGAILGLPVLPLLGFLRQHGVLLG
ncbi:MAG: Maf family protein [Acetobacteraceae bacterium]|nr:Maf family protein [Acetobacteraceae bacterium]